MASIQKIMVELDALLDTRQGTLLSYYPECMDDIFRLGKESKYYTRITDDMGELDNRIDSVIFREYYRNRTTDVLRLSVLTNMMAYLKDYIAALEKATIDSPVVQGYEVHVNCYPYRLSEEEKRLIGLAVVNFIRPPTKVTVVCIPLENMSTTELKEHYDMLILYNFVEWLKAIEPKMKTMARTPSLVVMAPMLFFDRNTIPTGSDNAEMDKMKTNPFKLTTKAAAEFFTLIFESIDIYSVIPVESMQFPNQKGEVAK